MQMQASRSCAILELTFRSYHRVFNIQRKSENVGGKSGRSVFSVLKNSGACFDDSVLTAPDAFINTDIFMYNICDR